MSETWAMNVQMLVPSAWNTTAAVREGTCHGCHLSEPCIRGQSQHLQLLWTILVWLPDANSDLLVSTAEMILSLDGASGASRDRWCRSLHFSSQFTCRMYLLHLPDTEHLSCVSFSKHLKSQLLNFLLAVLINPFLHSHYFPHQSNLLHINCGYKTELNGEILSDRNIESDWRWTLKLNYFQYWINGRFSTLTDTESTLIDPFYKRMLGMEYYINQTQLN